MKKWLFVACMLFTASALAFNWQPNQVPEGNHSYTLQMTSTAEDQKNLVTTVKIDITKQGDAYNVQTTYNIEQKNVSQDDLSDALYGGGALGLSALGPMLLYDPTFMMLPELLGNEDIHVRKDPVIIAGLGKIYMDKTIEAAGLKCVLLRFAPGDGSPPIKFAVADKVPFPCYSKYTDDDGSYTEIKLIEAK